MLSHDEDDGDYELDDYDDNNQYLLQLSNSPKPAAWQHIYIYIASIHKQQKKLLSLFNFYETESAS